MSKPLRVLVSGASIAGPALAYWLVRAGCKVTVVERAPTLRSAGQGVDVRETAREVIKRMGIFDIIKEKSSHEEGARFVDSNNHAFASFAADLESGKGDSMTCDIEILRGELGGILYDITKDNVSYIFGDMVESFEETDKEINVTFANGAPTESFDLLVAADGIGSKIRALAFGNGSSSSHINSLNSYVTYFSIPLGKTDSMWSRIHFLNGRRNIVLRPDNVGRTRAFFMQTFYDRADERLARYHKAAKEGISAQKALVQEFFEDGDWETDRILQGMHEADDFYFQHVAQVKLDRWSNGRVTVVGDAGYAPSPFTGMGTSIAFLGAYILAGEISKQPDNIPAALESYERVFHPYVKSVQKLLPGVPWIFLPESAWGVKVAETIIGGLGWVKDTWIASLLWKAVESLPGGSETKFELPEYDAFKD